MRELTETTQIGIIGAGAMGSGIAQVAAAAGFDVLVYDAKEGAAVAALQGIAKRLAKRVSEGKASEAESASTIARLRPAGGLADLSSCGVLIEAIVEDLEIKRALFSDLEELVSDDAILASNTSSLPIGAIAAKLHSRGRFAGLHFFNPVPTMKLVEVIRGPDTTQEVADALVSLGRKLGRTPVTVKDTPGFLVNFGGRAYTTEALSILHENVAQPAQIDAVMRDCFGFRMGPFELMDLTGIDVNFPVTRFVHESTFGDPRLRSTPLHRYMLETGQLGRKTGRGFYDYDLGGAAPSPDATTDAQPAEYLTVHGGVNELRELALECGAQVLAADDGVSPILAAPIGEDATAYASRNNIDYHRLVCLDTVSGTTKRVTLMAAPGCDGRMRDSVIALLAKHRSVTAIQDSPGFIGQRIIAMVANLGCEMAQIGLASVEDIDIAMRLGLNYPLGPLEFVDTIGPETVHGILACIQNLTGDDRYRPSQWLRRSATLGLSAGQT